MEIMAKLYLVTSEGQKFMGIGVLWLLEQLRVENSLRSAALKLGISYSKAFAMVKNLEEYLGVAVIERKRGGAKREGACLTPFGEQFLTLYNQFQREAKEQLNAPFSQFSKELELLIKKCSLKN
ncbi:MAG: winged helix-turn-helix domain-containing protein [Sphaerochaetaceae bacterium]|jgi:molybdate transport system regulatory protein|nr:LysR family transcriptional regulator [Sphaerochaetaceae bacterium]HHU88537.1 LysR family transcriptional regulator [Spirochaetales bacterium]